MPAYWLPKVDHLLTSLYTFILPFLLLSSIFIDLFLDYSLTFGSLFYTIDRCSVITPAAIDIHFAIISMACFLRFNSLIRSPIFQSSLALPFYQDLLLLMSLYFVKGPANLIEVLTCSNQCYNLWHVHYYNTLFLVWLLLI